MCLNYSNTLGLLVLVSKGDAWDTHIFLRDRTIRASVGAGELHTLRFVQYLHSLFALMFYHYRDAMADDLKIVRIRWQCVHAKVRQLTVAFALSGTS